MGKIAAVYGVGVVGFWAFALWVAVSQSAWETIYRDLLTGLLWPVFLLLVAVAGIN
jgi:hypothetical protein